MGTIMSRKNAVVIGIAVLSCVSVAAVAADKRKPPPTVYWLTAQTGGFAAGGAGGADMAAQMMAGGGGGPRKYLDLRLGSTLAVAPAEAADHTIPPALNMGASLPLLPVTRAVSSYEDGQPPQKPKGRILVYWGCSKEVRPGQPKIIDFARPESGAFWAGGYHGGATGPTPSWKTFRQWPNKESGKAVPGDASLAGDHVVKAGSLPDIRFSVPADRDFLPAVHLRQSDGSKATSVGLAWGSVAGATGYFAQATGAKSGGTDMVIWSSSETPEPGWGLVMGYPSQGEVASLIKKQVVLPPETTSCSIPTGIFAEAEGAAVQFAAFGAELNLDHPSAPTDPDWAVKLRRKAMAMLMVDVGSMDDMMSGQGGSSPGKHKPGASPACDGEGSNCGGTPSPLDAVPGGGLLKGLFGN